MAEFPLRKLKVYTTSIYVGNNVERICVKTNLFQHYAISAEYELTKYESG